MADGADCKAGDGLGDEIDSGSIASSVLQSALNATPEDGQLVISGSWTISTKLTREESNAISQPMDPCQIAR